MAQKGDTKDSKAKIAAKFEGYVARNDVKQIYAAMAVSAQGIDVTNSAIEYLAKPEVNAALVKMAPKLAPKLGKAANLSKALGRAAAVLGVAFDLMVAFGLLQTVEMKKLDHITQLLEELTHEVRQGFKSVRSQLRTNQALQRFLPFHDKILSNVVRFEQVLKASGEDPESFSVKLEPLVRDYSPNKIIQDLHMMHILITGEAEFAAKPLFVQLAEEASLLEGEDFDQFIACLILQFHTVTGLEVRAIRMLRSFIAFEEKDINYSTDVQSIFERLAIQRKSCDPAMRYAWYVKFKAFGGELSLATAPWPDWYVYMQNTGTGNVRGWKNHPGDQGVFKVTPHPDGEKYLVSSKKWPGWYMYMQETIDGNVRGWKGDPGSQGHWRFAIKCAETRTFVMTTCKWPDWYMYMQGGDFGNVRGCKGDPGPQGHLVLSLI